VQDARFVRDVPEAEPEHEIAELEDLVGARGLRRGSPLRLAALGVPDHGTAGGHPEYGRPPHCFIEANGATAVCLPTHRPSSCTGTSGA
jgi:hypothetical protein